MHDSRLVANHFIQRAENPLTALQVIKLVYIAHGWMLGLYDRELINQKVKAWKHGPVIPELYESVRKFRGSPIDMTLEVPVKEIKELHHLEDDLINQVTEKYSQLSGIVLSQITHQLGTPWHEVYKQDSDTEIPNSMIREYYHNKHTMHQNSGITRMTQINSE